MFCVKTDNGYDRFRHHNKRWDLIGQGHLCRFRMKGHLDMSLNWLMLDPRQWG